MVNDNQRCEAANNIRQFLSVSQNERAWDNDGLQTVGRLVGTSVGENILVRLADLIDRPTCKMESYQGVLYGRCSHCGAFVRRDAATDCTGESPSSTAPTAERRWSNERVEVLPLLW